MSLKYVLNYRAMCMKKKQGHGVNQVPLVSLFSISGIPGAGSGFLRI